MAVRHEGFEFRVLRMAGRRIDRVEAGDLREAKRSAAPPATSPPPGSMGDAP
jgi:hypothetical protein